MKRWTLTMSPVCQSIYFLDPYSHTLSSSLRLSLSLFLALSLFLYHSFSRSLSLPLFLSLSLYHSLSISLSLTLSLALSLFLSLSLYFIFITHFLFCSFFYLVPFHCSTNLFQNWTSFFFRIELEQLLDHSGQQTTPGPHFYSNTPCTIRQYRGGTATRPPCKQLTVRADGGQLRRFLLHGDFEKCESDK